MAYVIYFSQIKPQHEDIVGVKGLNLAILSKEFNVPQGFVITAKAYEDFLKKTLIKSRIDNMLSKISKDNIQKTANEIQQLIVEAQMPEDIKKEILESYEALDFEKSAKANDLIATNVDINVAVRSSYIKDEASENLSQLTFLNISGEQRLITAIKVCYASLYTAKNIVERSEKNKGIDVKTAIVIQKMIDADASAVSYSFNPNTKNHDEIYINAVYGLGESFTINDSAFDVYIADKNSLEIKSVVVAEQKIMHELDEKTKKTKATTLEGIGKRQKLSEEEIRLAAEITKQVSSWFEYEQKVELALWGGEFYVLQSKNAKEKSMIKRPDEVIIEKIGIADKDSGQVAKSEIPESREEKQKPRPKKKQEKKQQAQKEEQAEGQDDFSVEDEIWPQDIDFIDMVEREVEKYQSPLKKAPKKENKEIRKYKFGKYDEEKDLVDSLEKQEEEQPKEDYAIDEDGDEPKTESKKKQPEEKELKGSSDGEADDSIFSGIK